MATPTDTTSVVSSWGGMINVFEETVQREKEKVESQSLIGTDKRSALIADYDKKIEALEAFEKDVTTNNPLVKEYYADKEKISDLSTTIERHEEEFSAVEGAAIGHPWYQRLFDAYDPKSPDPSTSILGTAKNELNQDKIEMYGLQQKWFQPPEDASSLDITRSKRVG